MKAKKKVVIKSSSYLLQSYKIKVVITDRMFVFDCNISKTAKKTLSLGFLFLISLLSISWLVVCLFVPQWPSCC